MSPTFPIEHFPATLSQVCADCAECLRANNRVGSQYLLRTLGEIGDSMYVLFHFIPLPVLYAGVPADREPNLVVARPLDKEEYEDFSLLDSSSRDRLASYLDRWADYYSREARAISAAAELLAVARRHSEAQSPTAMPQPDGPSAAGLFYVAGKSYPFSAYQWRLLKVLFGRGGVPVEEVLSAVYPGEEDVSDGRLRKLIHETEKRFEKHGLLGYDIERPISGYISLRCPD
jgi:hypothetical protein